MIDEDNSFVKEKLFAKCIQKSSNYYLLITRNYLVRLPVSVTEIYELKGNKNKRFQPVYPEIDRMYSYSDDRYLPFVPEVIITEDSKTGYYFFDALTENTSITCIPAGGKTNISSLLGQYSDKKVLIVADGAAFGMEVRDIVLRQNVSANKIAMYLPESFEWLLLKSGIVSNAEDERVVIPEAYIDSEKYFSWERYFTDLLVEITIDIPYKKYPRSKNRLPKYYTSQKSMAVVKTVMTQVEFEAKLYSRKKILTQGLRYQ